MARKHAAVVLSRADEVMNRINAQMKRDVITTASDPRFRIERVPTGSLTIDRLTGGGFARGRHVELYGDWTVGKSLLLYMTLVLAQKRGEVCALLDTENIFNADWFTALGGNVDDLLMPDLNNANEMGNILRLMEQETKDSPGVDIVGIDSVASLLTKEELEHDLEEGDARVASLARFMSLLLRQTTMPNDKTLFIWTNQWREKIARIPGLKSNPGGSALGFYASTRIEMMKGEKETDSRRVVRGGKWVERKVPLGVWVNCTAKKEKTGARPETSKSILLDYDKRQFDVARQIIDLGMEDELITRTGDYFIMPTPDGTEKRSHGIKNACKAIDGDDELREFLSTCIEERTVEIANGP